MLQRIDLLDGSQREWRSKKRWTAMPAIDTYPLRDSVLDISFPDAGSDSSVPDVACLLHCLQLADTGGLPPMICPIDFKRLLFQNRALRLFACRATASARHAQVPFYRKASSGCQSRRSLLKQWSTSTFGRSQTLCTMSEAVQAPAAENGAVDGEVEALKEKIAELQVWDAFCIKIT